MRYYFFLATKIKSRIKISMGVVRRYRVNDYTKLPAQRAISNQDILTCKSRHLWAPWRYQKQSEVYWYRGYCIAQSYGWPPCEPPDHLETRPPSPVSLCPKSLTISSQGLRLSLFSSRAQKRCCKFLMPTPIISNQRTSPIQTVGMTGATWYSIPPTHLLPPTNHPLATMSNP